MSPKGVDKEESEKVDQLMSKYEIISRSIFKTEYEVEL